MKSKFASRKFWISVAAFLASLGTGIGGIIVGNQSLQIVGLACTVVSAAIYASCEAYVDGQSAAASIKTTTDQTITTVKQ